MGIKSLPPSAQLKLCEVGSPLGLAQKPGQGATQQTKLRNPVLQDTKLVHSHGRSQEESSVASDLGNKKEMVGCRYQALASWCGVRGVQNQEVLFTQIPLLLPTAPSSLLSHGHPRTVALPARLTYLGLAQCTADKSGQPGGAQAPPQKGSQVRPRQPMGKDGSAG